MPLGHVMLAQDGFEKKLFTENPEFSFFVSNPGAADSREPPFSMEDLEQYFSTEPGFSKRVSCTLHPNADMLTNVYLVVRMPNLPFVAGAPAGAPYVWKYKSCAGHRIIKTAEFQADNVVLQRLGGQTIDVHWKLRNTRTKNSDIMIGDVDDLLQFSETKKEQTLYVPLPFWFTAIGADAFPIGKLGVGPKPVPVQINIEFANMEDVLDFGPTHYMLVREDAISFDKYEDLYQYGEKIGVFMGFDHRLRRLYFNLEPGTRVRYDSSDDAAGVTALNLLFSKGAGYFISSQDKKKTCTPESEPRDSGMRMKQNIELQEAYLLVTNVYLDNAEQATLRESPVRKIVIPQTQVFEFPDIESRKQFLSIPAKNPVYEIIWTVSLNADDDPYKYRSIISRFGLKFNGCDIVSTRSGEHAEKLNLMQHYAGFTIRGGGGIYGYPIALNPESAYTQPSGATNMDKIEKAVLYVELLGVDIDSGACLIVHANSYNVLEISKEGTIRLLF